MLCSHADGHPSINVQHVPTGANSPVKEQMKRKKKREEKKKVCVASGRERTNKSAVQTRTTLLKVSRAYNTAGGEGIKKGTPQKSTLHLILGSRWGVLLSNGTWVTWSSSV
jgi:hypothetical protein